VIEMHAGEVFYIPPTPHDSWVVGNEPYGSLHFLGADHYARGQQPEVKARSQKATAGP
jgi:hypothetical protein